MITSKPLLYYNTGLQVGDIPETTAKVADWASSIRQFDDHVGLQDLFLTSFRLKATWDEVKNADYMKFGSAYYWIRPRMINENCAEITCIRDDLTTLGGPLNLEYDSGYITRAHPLRKTDYSNTLDEPVGPARVLIANSTPIQLAGGASADLSIVASTVKLDDPNVSLSPSAVRDALVFSSQVGTSTSSSEYTIAIPLPPAASPTTMLRSMGKTVNTVGFGLYDATNATVKKNLQYLRSIGLSDAVLFSYRLPRYNISFNISTDGLITFIYGGGVNAFDGGNTLDMKMGIDNNPVGFLPKFYKTYLMNRTFTCRSRLSGDSKTFRPQEIWSPSNNDRISFQVAIDPNYQGTTYCSPQYYNGVEDDGLKIANSVKGLPWAENPISIGGATGSRFAKNELAADLRSASLGGQLGEGNIGGISGSGLGGILTNATGAASSLNELGSYLMGGNYQAPQNLDPYAYAQAQARAKYAQSQIQAPVLTSSPAFGLQNYVDNSFDVVDVRPCNEDLQVIDNYFNRYGYKQPNIPFKKDYLTSMSSFNYIEGFDIKIAPSAATSSFGREVIEGAQAQLCGGCRVWHVKPSNIASN